MLFLYCAVGVTNFQFACFDGSPPENEYPLTTVPTAGATLPWAFCPDVWYAGGIKLSTILESNCESNKTRRD